MRTYTSARGGVMRVLITAIYLAFMVSLASCGGGASSTAGVGTGGSGLGGVTATVDGSITGFGSVIVNGIAYDDTNASIQKDDGTGTLRGTNLKLGQQVRLQLNEQGKVVTVSVNAQLTGPVTTAQDGTGTLRVLGQWVRLSGSASDAPGNALAHVAGFGGAQAQVGDEVEVHGAWVYDPAHARYVLVATRLEKLESQGTLVQISGVVVSKDATTLGLNETNAWKLAISNAPASVNLGSVVAAWVSRATWAAHALGDATLPLAITRLINASAIITDPTSVQKVRLVGPVAQYNAATRTLEIEGVKVVLPASLTVNPTLLVPGKMLNLEVLQNAGTLVIDALTLQGAAGSDLDFGQTISIRAVSSGVLWTANPAVFILRDVVVIASPASISSACLAANATDNILIDVKGYAVDGTDMVSAVTVTCSGATNLLATPATGSPPIVQRSGGVLLVSSDENFLVLADGLWVQWDAQTVFDPGFAANPASMAGKTVNIEGIAIPGGLRARQIGLASAP